MVIELDNGKGCVQHSFSGYVGTINISAKSRIKDDSGSVCVRFGCEINTEIRVNESAKTLVFDYDVDIDEISVVCPESFESIEITYSTEKTENIQTFSCF